MKKAIQVWYMWTSFSDKNDKNRHIEAVHESVLELWVMRSQQESRGLLGICDYGKKHNFWCGPVTKSLIVIELVHGGLQNFLCKFSD